MSIMLIAFQLVLVHFLADFVFQTEWQARNKNTSNVALTQHVGVYTAIILIWALSLVYSQSLPLRLCLLWVLVNSVLHWLTDYVTSRINAKLSVTAKANDHFHLFFVGIGFDQVLHYACLMGTFQIIFDR